MTTTTGIHEICDRTLEMIHEGATYEGMKHLHTELNRLRAEHPSGRLSAEEIKAHPVCSLIHRDPITFHAFAKPRGYAGDAELLDYIYQIAEPSAADDVYRFNVDTGACRSVRARRQIVADYIDRAAEQSASPKVISIACGHLREALLSRAVSEGRIGEFIALDQDAESLALIETELAGRNITTLEASVLQIVTGKISFSDADLVYSAGLYDYLEPRVARRLTSRMFSMLRPGGTMLIANFAPNLEAIGYMETFMDWHLIYRNESEIAGVAADIDSQAVADYRVFRDEPGNLVFLEVVKG